MASSLQPKYWAAQGLMCCLGFLPTRKDFYLRNKYYFGTSGFAELPYSNNVLICPNPYNV